MNISCPEWSNNRAYLLHNILWMAGSPWLFCSYEALQSLQRGCMAWADLLRSILWYGINWPDLSGWRCHWTTSGSVCSHHKRSIASTYHVVWAKLVSRWRVSIFSASDLIKSKKDPTGVLGRYQLSQTYANESLSKRISWFYSLFLSPTSKALLFMKIGQ